MAISSLSKLSVPVPGGASNQALLMPLLSYRFRVLLQGFGITQPSTELTKQVFSVTRPKVNYENIQLHVYNSIVNVQGKHTLDAITLVVRDDATGVVSKLVGEQQQKQFDYFEQASAASGIDYKFQMLIQMLDGGNGAYDPTVLNTFELDGCYLTNVDYAPLSYDANTDVRITMSVMYDNMLQVDGAGNPNGIGINVGRTLGTLSTG